jgi:hypothetical protein
MLGYAEELVEWMLLFFVPLLYIRQVEFVGVMLLAADPWMVETPVRPDGLVEKLATQMRFVFPNPSYERFGTVVFPVQV